MGCSGRQHVLESGNQARALLVRADADAQEIRNTWLGEMPDENVPLPQAGLKRYTRLSLVPGKTKLAWDGRT